MSWRGKWGRGGWHVENSLNGEAQNACWQLIVRVFIYAWYQLFYWVVWEEILKTCHLHFVLLRVQVGVNISNGNVLVFLISFRDTKYVSIFTVLNIGVMVLVLPWEAIGIPDEWRYGCTGNSVDPL